MPLAGPSSLPTWPHVIWKKPQAEALLTALAYDEPVNADSTADQGATDAEDRLAVPTGFAQLAASDGGGWVQQERQWCTEQGGIRYAALRPGAAPDSRPARK
jgi:hypothetical protein